ncbi:MAG: tetratricopeptide repeat protein, partial [Verrucomicrobiales bacterium]
MAQQDTHPDSAADEKGIELLLSEAKGLTWSEDWRRSPFVAAQAVALAIQSFGTSHPQTAKAFHGLGEIFASCGAVKEALLCHQEELAVRMNNFGLEHPDTSTALHNIGYLLIRSGRHEESLPYLAEALGIRQRLLGPTHIAVGVTLGCIADSYAASGNAPAARYFTERNLEIRRAVLGAEHPVTQGLALALEKLGDQPPLTDSPEELLENARFVPWQIYGNGGPEAVARVSDVARLLEKLNAKAGSREYLMAAVALSREIMGSGHPQTGDLLDELGVSLTSAG